MQRLKSDALINIDVFNVLGLESPEGETRFGYRERNCAKDTLGLIWMPTQLDCPSEMLFMESLLEKRADAKCRQGYLVTPLRPAVVSYHLSVVKFTLDKGTDINTRGGDYGTALLAAVSRGHTKSMVTL